jgi:hypothetical protein
MRFNRIRIILTPGNTPAPFAGGKVHFEPQYTIFA